MISREEMIQWVLAKMDEIIPEGINQFGETFVDGPVGFIEKELDYSVRFVLQSAPDDMVMGCLKKGGKHNKAGTVNSRLLIDENTKVGTYVLPTDFLRFIELKLSSWKQSVTSVMGYKDPEFSRQVLRFRRGTPRKPVAVLRPFKEYTSNEQANEDNCNLSLELYSCGPDCDDTVEKFYYVPNLELEKIPENLHDPVAWVCASRALQILRLGPESKSAMERANLQLNNYLIGKK